MRIPRRRCSLWGVLAAVCPCFIVLACIFWILLQGDDGDAPQRLVRRVAAGPNCAPNRAYACVATSYYAALGCFTVAKSLILSKTSCPIYVLSTEDVSSRTISWIESELGAQVRTRAVRWPRGRRPFDPQIAVIGVWEVMREYQKVRIVVVV